MTDFQTLMTSESPSPNDESKSRLAFDLEERTALFGGAIVRFARKISGNPVSTPCFRHLSFVTL
jgi:hypothetical protein